MKTERLLIYIFGVSFLAAFLIVAIFFPEPTYFQHQTFRTILSISGGAIGIFLTGKMRIKSKWVKATGGFAVLVLIYYSNPVGLISEIKEPKLIDVNVIGSDYHKEVSELGVTVFPNFRLQDVFDKVRNYNLKFPVILDFKILNESQRPYFLKEIEVVPISSKLDSTPVWNHYPLQLDPGNLHLKIENLGWTPVEGFRIRPLSSEVLMCMGITNYNELDWKGQIANNLLLTIDKSLLTNRDLLSISELDQIKEVLGPRSNRTYAAAGWAVDSVDQKARDLYLKPKKGVSNFDFFGELLGADINNSVLRKLSWGTFESNYDLLFTEEGFFVLPLPTYRQYIPPSHNYDLRLSHDDHSKKSINSSQLINAKSADRFTISIISTESVEYTLQIKLLFDKGYSTKTDITIKTLAFRNPENSGLTKYHFETGEWVEK